ncbi:MAG TPA: GAF domain-containing protein [Candidatus Limnocylindrales bacterium]|nr:GAF domain-containing protein [Candidatus Limnocylindrales bacterium]
MTDDGAVRALLAAVARRLDAIDRLAAAPSDDLLSAIAATAVTALDAQAASIAVHDPATDRLVFAAAAGPAAGGVVGMTIDASTGIAGYAFSTGQPLAVADAAADPRFDRSVAEATGYVPSTLLAAPLSDDAGTVGVLEALDHRGGSFTLRDLDIATAIAREATIVIRAGGAHRDATILLRAAFAALLRDGDGASMDAATIDKLVSEATTNLASGEDDARWRLIDRIARLRDVDPESLELAADWLDALLRRTGQGAVGGRPRAP